MKEKGFHTISVYFCQPKKTGGHFGSPPNLAISSQKMMKRGKGILWVEIFTN